MANADKVQRGGIQFGERWKLVPVDGENWELCHLHVTTPTASSRKAGTDGTERWHRIGKYYNEHTIGSALRYAADREMKLRHADEAAAITDALAEWERILRDFTDRLSETREAMR